MSISRPALFSALSSAPKFSGPQPKDYSLRPSSPTGVVTEPRRPMENRAVRFGKFSWRKMLENRPNAAVKALINAVNRGDKARITTLVQAGADINGRHWGLTPLMHAASRGDAHMVAFLLEGIPKLPDKADNANNKAGHSHQEEVSAASGEAQKSLALEKIIVALEALLNAESDAFRADPDIRTPDGETALALALSIPGRSAKPSSGRVGVIELLAPVTDLSGLPKWGEPVLNTAINNGYSKFVSMMLARGAQVDVSGRDGLTPLMHAVMNGKVEVARQLIESLPDGEPQTAYVNRRNVFNRTALSIAKEGSPMAKLLRSKGGEDPWRPRKAR